MIPAWSPDGKSIVVMVFSRGRLQRSGDAIDLATGKRSCSLPRDSIVQRPEWMRDGRVWWHLLDAAQSDHLTFPIPTAHRTRHPRYQQLLGSQPGGRGTQLATVMSEGHFNLFIMPAASNATTQLRQVTSGTAVYRFSWTAIRIRSDSGDAAQVGRIRSVGRHELRCQLPG